MLFMNSEMLLKAVLHKPKDKDAKRAYADSLLEEGHELRGNFISRQLVNKSFMFNCADENLDKELGLNTLPLSVIKSLKVTVVAGFVMHLETTHYYFFRYAKVLFATHPILSVKLTDRYPLIRDLTLDSREISIWSRVKSFSRGQYRYYLHPRICNHIDQDCGFDGRYFFNNAVFALNAASKACVCFGRAEAGLPALKAKEFRGLSLKQDTDGFFVTEG